MCSMSERREEVPSPARTMSLAWNQGSGWTCIGVSARQDHVRTMRKMIEEVVDVFDKLPAGPRAHLHHVEDSTDKALSSLLMAR